VSVIGIDLPGKIGDVIVILPIDRDYSRLECFFVFFPAAKKVRGNDP